MLQRYDKLPIRLVWRRGGEEGKIVVRRRVEMPWEAEGVSMQRKGGRMASRWRGLLWVALETYCGLP